MEVLSVGISAYRQLAQKAYKRNTRYRSAHMINNVASAIFGFIYISIWQAASGNPGDISSLNDAVSSISSTVPADVYTPQTMVHYVAFSQVIVWITVFLPSGLGIPQVVRTGAVSLEMLRPVDYHLHIIARETGTLWYNALFRCIPLALVFALTVGLYVPADPTTWPRLAAALVLAAYVAVCLHYLSGIVAFWTVNASWARQILITLHFGLSGFLVPIDLLPGPLPIVARLLPFASLQYVPARVYLELSGIEALIPSVIWAVTLTILCRFVTTKARHKLEVQGG